MKHRPRDSHGRSVKKELDEQDPYKLSIHTSSNFNRSDSGSKRQNISRMLQNSRKKISMRKASQLFSSGVRPKSSKVTKRNQIIQFDNIKWISIISAYDPNRLKNVSVSKKSCQKFLQKQGHNLKNDPRSMLYFNDLIKNYKSWLNKIHIQYYYIMEKFLNSRRSVNITLAEIRPKLDEVIQQTGRMQQNLQQCLATYQNHQFRQLLRRYFVYLQNSKEIQDIIVVVNKSKNKIDDLFQRFQDDRKIEQKINKVKQQGINQVKKIVCEHKQIALQNQIMSRIQIAINEMAQKSGQAYRKIRGIKQLIERFKSAQHQSQHMNKVDMGAISLMSKVCKQICVEAEAFESFSDKFLQEGDIINDDLKGVIRKYQQEVCFERKKAIQLQIKFLNVIFSQTIKKLKANVKIAIVYQNSEDHHEEYRMILRMIQDIADCLIDQNKKILLQKLLKQTRTVFDRLYDELKYLKEGKKFQQIDTEEGLISILQVSKLIKQYKQKINLIRKKFQIAHRELALPPIKIQPITGDPESDYINNVIELSKKINNSGLKQKLHKVPCFVSVSHLGLQKMSNQIQTSTILDQITSISNQFLLLQEKNILEKYFGPLKLQNSIFKESVIMLEMKRISSKTKQTNLIPQLQELTKKRNQWLEKYRKISTLMKRYFQRILARTFVLGLKPQEIKEIDNSNEMIFPTKASQIQTLKNKAKYRNMLLDLIQNSASHGYHNFQSQNHIDKQDPQLKGHYHNHIQKTKKSTKNFQISIILERNILAINNFIRSFQKISETKKNLNSEYFLPKQYIFEFCAKLFRELLLKDKMNNKDTAIKLIKQIIQILNQRTLSLTRKIFDEENEWKQTLEHNQNHNQEKEKEKNPPIHVRKLIQAIEFYKANILKLYEACKSALDQYTTPIQKVQNSEEEIKQYKQLSLYSKLILNFVKYCKQTNQIVHVILDAQKNPIALINPKQNILKQIFPGLKKGKLISAKQYQKQTLTLAKIGIQIKMIKPTSAKKSKQPVPSKDLKKNSKSKDKQNSSDIMDEEICEQSQNYEEQFMDQDIQSQNNQIGDNIDEIDDVQEVAQYEDQMMDQFEQQINQEPEEQVIEQASQPQQQMSEDIQPENIEEENLQELLDQSQNLGKSKNKQKKQIQKNNNSKNNIDDFEQYDWEEPKNKNKHVSKNQKNKQITKDNKDQAKKGKDSQIPKQQEQKNKKQKEQKERQARIKKQHIVFSQTSIPKKIIQATVYEVLTFISSLFQLKKLICYVLQFSQNYMKNSLDWQKIQQHFNSHCLFNASQNSQQKVQKYIKSIEQDVQNKLKQDYQSETIVFNQIKNLQQIKNLKKSLVLLKNGNWEILQNTLKQNQFSFNVLKSPNTNTNFYINIKKMQSSYEQEGSIHGYLSKSFKFYQQNQFDIKSFISKCFNKKQTLLSSQKIICYTPKKQKSLINEPLRIQQSFVKSRQLMNNLCDSSRDILDKFDFCMQLLKKSLNIKQKPELNLAWYSQQIKFLQRQVGDQFSPLFYTKIVSQKYKETIKKLKSLESKLQNIAFKCSKQNYFQCINELFELYGPQIQKNICLDKGNKKQKMLIFDKANIDKNIQRINKAINSQVSSNEQAKIQKIMCNLFFQSFLNKDKFIEQINPTNIFLNSRKINLKDSSLVLRVLSTLGISHSYILTEKDKQVSAFILKKQKQECISVLLKKLIAPLQTKIVSKTSKHTYLQSLASLIKSQDPKLYLSIFSTNHIKVIFKQNVTSSGDFRQTQIIIDSNWVNLQDQNINSKFFDSLIECVQNLQQKIKSILSGLNKLKPCKFIFQKYLNQGQTSQNNSKWQDHLNVLQKIDLTAKNILNTKNWLLSVASIQSQMKDSTIQSLDQNINAIKSMLKPSTGNNSVAQVQIQMKNAYDWLQNIREVQNSPKFNVISIDNIERILYFDLATEKLTIQNFKSFFTFLAPDNEQLHSFLYNILTQSWKVQTNQGNDINYIIDSKVLSQNFIKSVQSILNSEYQHKRQKILREFVRKFNKIYFNSKTTQTINFKQQIQSLLNLQKDFKSYLKQLQNAYLIKKFIQNYQNSFFKGNQTIQKSLKLLNNNLNVKQKIKEQDISQIIKRMDKIKIKRNSNQIQSYSDFFSWFFYTIKNTLDLPFYNIITHGVKNDKNAIQNEFMTVVLTSKPCDPGQTDNQLEECLKEMFLITNHKPIYLKSDQLTVQLEGQTVIVQLTHTFKDTNLQQVLTYFKTENQQQNQQKMFYLRIDQTSNIQTQNNTKVNQQRKLLQLIPLEDFLKSSEQKFNIEVTQEVLTVSVEFNIVEGPRTIDSTTPLNQLLPLNGKLFDSFNDVYIGKKLKIQKNSQWLQNLYNKKKLQALINQNRDAQLQFFFKGVMKSFMEQIQQSNKKTISSILHKIKFQTLINQNIHQSQCQLILPSSKNLVQQLSAQIDKYKERIFKQDENTKNYYEQDIQKLGQKIIIQLKSELTLVESSIKKTVTQKCKKTTDDQIQRIEKLSIERKLQSKQSLQENLNNLNNQNPSDDLNKNTNEIREFDQQLEGDKLQKLKSQNFEKYLQEKLILQFQEISDKQFTLLSKEIAEHFKGSLKSDSDQEYNKVISRLKEKVQKYNFGVQDNETGSKSKRDVRMSWKIMFFSTILNQTKDINYIKLFCIDEVSSRKKN